MTLEVVSRMTLSPPGMSMAQGQRCRPLRMDATTYKEVRRVGRYRRVLALEVRRSVALKAIIHQTILGEPRWKAIRDGFKVRARRSKLTRRVVHMRIIRLGDGIKDRVEDVGSGEEANIGVLRLEFRDESIPTVLVRRGEEVLVSNLQSRKIGEVKVELRKTNVPPHI